MKIMDVTLPKEQSRTAYCVLVLFALIIYLVEANLASSSSIFFYALAGVAFIKFYFEKGDNAVTVNVFLITFASYIGYALCFRYVYQQGNLAEMLSSSHSNIWDDQIKFYLNAKYLEDHSVHEIVRLSYRTLWFSESPLFAVLLGLIGKAGNWLDESNYTFFLFHVTFLSSFIPVFIYKIARFYFSRKLAYKVAIVYTFFSFSLFFSGRLLRDPHIALVFIWAMYLICNPKRNIKAFIQLLLLVVVCYNLRVEHGYFMVSFIMLYCLLWGKKLFKDTRLVAMIMSFTFLLSFSIFSPRDLGVDKVVDTGADTYTRYEKSSLEGASIDSFGKDLMRLPVPVNYVATGAFGQLQPFPLWVSLGVKGNRTNWIWFPQAVAGAFWFLCWCFIIKGRAQGTQLIKIVPVEMLYLSLLSILLILLTSANIGVRRVYCVYPPIYFLAIFSYLKMTRVHRVALVQFGFVVLVILHLVYSLMKIMQGKSPI